MTGRRRHRLYSYGVGRRRDVILVGFLVLCGMFLAFLSELKKIFVLFIWRKQELSGDTRILGTGERDGVHRWNWGRQAHALQTR